jgi:outer membrane lipase/esterase
MVGIALCFSVLLPGWADAQVSFNQIITFGDSLSDPGNYWLLTGDFTKIPFTEAIPDSPYAIGGFHFSNGRTWIEQLATDLHMPTSGRPAVLVPGVYTNYAIGRSRARPVLPPVLACASCYLAAQVEQFLNDFHNTASEDALYVVFIGANDLQDALRALETDPTGGTSVEIILQAIGSTSDNILKLHGYGARMFLVPNLPNIASTPALIAAGPDAQAVAYYFSTLYDDLLEIALGTLDNLPDIQIIRLNVFEALETVVNSPESAGFSVVDLPCLTFGVVQGAICSKPKTYLFWDGIHPTTAGHDFLSDQAKEALSAP